VERHASCRSVGRSTAIVAWAPIIVTTSQLGAIYVVGGCQIQFALVNLARLQSAVPSMVTAALVMPFATWSLFGQNLAVVGSLTQSAQESLAPQGSAGRSMAIVEPEKPIATKMRFGDQNVVILIALVTHAGMVSVGQSTVIVEWGLIIATRFQFGRKHVVALLEVALGIHAPSRMNAAHSMDTVVPEHLIVICNQFGAPRVQTSKMAVGACL